jgi:hypothetical protein
MAQGCRPWALHQVGSYLGYSGREANAFGMTARDPKRTIEPLDLVSLHRGFDGLNDGLNSTHCGRWEVPFQRSKADTEKPTVKA